MTTTSIGAPESRFVYVTYINTTAEKLWQALTSPEFNRQFWFGSHQESGWTPGAAWKLVFPDGRIGDTGEIVEVDRPRRLVIKWRNAPGLMGGLSTGVMMAVFFGLAVSLYSFIYGPNSPAFIGIDAGHFIVCYGIAGAILGAWK